MRDAICWQRSVSVLSFPTLTGSLVNHSELQYSQYRASFSTFCCSFIARTPFCLCVFDNGKRTKRQKCAKSVKIRIARNVPPPPPFYTATARLRFDSRMRTYARSSCASELDFDRGFEALPGPAGRVLSRLLCC